MRWKISTELTLTLLYFDVRSTFFQVSQHHLYQNAAMRSYCQQHCNVVDGEYMVLVNSCVGLLMVQLICRACLCWGCYGLTLLNKAFVWGCTICASTQASDDGHIWGRTQVIFQFSNLIKDSSFDSVIIRLPGGWSASIHSALLVLITSLIIFFHSLMSHGMCGLTVLSLFLGWIFPIWAKPAFVRIFLKFPTLKCRLSALLSVPPNFSLVSASNAVQSPFPLTFYR